MSLDKKWLLILHVITKEIEYNIEYFHLYVVVKMFFLWKSHNLDKTALGTCTFAIQVGTALMVLIRSIRPKAHAIASSVIKLLSTT